MLNEINGILEIPTKLSQVIDSLKKPGVERRKDIADLFKQIADLLKKVADKLQSGEEPYEEVGEIQSLAEKLPAFLKPDISEDEARELHQLLEEVIGNKSSINLEDLKKNEAIVKIRTCVGEFNALARTVTPKPPSVKKILFLVLGVIGLGGVISWLLFPDIATNVSRRFAPQDGCLALLQEGRTLHWKTTDRNGEPINKGTLVITYANAEVGKWVGEHTTSNKDSDNKFIVDGTFDSSSMVMDNPAYQGERWRGNCNSEKIEGSIEMFGYQDQPRFEMY